MVELLLALLGCAALLGIIAAYYHYMDDAEVIDEEEEASVEGESPEERARLRLERAEESPLEASDYQGDGWE